MVENVPSATATKPGDIVKAMNGMTIKVCSTFHCYSLSSPFAVQIDNTDAEGRLILADALTYSDEFKPHAVLDCATLTGAMMIALGAGAAGVFCSDDGLWNELQQVRSVAIWERIL